MMQFDSLFMIKVAESKDLFGTSKAQQQSKHDIILNRAVQTSQSSTRKRAKRIKVINYLTMKLYWKITIKFLNRNSLIYNRGIFYKISTLIF